MDKLSPYLDPQWISSRREFITCSVSAAFERDAALFCWNEKVSGKHISILLDNEEEFVPIICPYHKRTILTYSLLLEEIRQTCQDVGVEIGDEEEEKE